MDHSSNSPEERFAAIVEELLSNPEVTPPGSGKGFGSAGLKVHHKIFAMLVEGKLVLKLPKMRIDAIIAAGDGERFDPRHNGRTMKEWVVVEPASHEEWLLLAREAMEFVAAQR